jgi:hypothetical protein
MTYHHFFKNRLWGVRRAWDREAILLLSYHLKFFLFGAMVYCFTEWVYFGLASFATLCFVFVSSLFLGHLGFHYQWEFGSGRLLQNVTSRGIAFPRDFKYHLHHDLGAYIGVQAALWVPWLFTS